MGLQKDDKYGWKLKVKGNCDEVLKDIIEKLGEFGHRYFEERLIIEPADRTEATNANDATNEN